MLDRERHLLVLGRILKDVYTDAAIAPLLGFKGGTCAALFYGLPRISVGLDFDLLTPESAGIVLDRLAAILRRYGSVKDSHVKRNTIFLLLSYGASDRNVKVEVSTRTDVPDLRSRFELKEHLGISLLVATKPYLFAGKLAALTGRDGTAMRDIYDAWYFASRSWDIDAEAVRIRTGKEVAEQLADCIAVIERVTDNQVLHGLGELVEERQKAWVKRSLRKEAAFLLRNYRAAMR